MKKTIVLSMLALGLAAIMAAQTPAAPPAAPPAAAAAAPAPAACANPTKVGIISMADALSATKEGQKAGADLQSKYQPRAEAFDKRNADIQNMLGTLSKGKATMSADAQASLQAKIDAANKNLKRDQEDAQAEMDEEKGKVLNAMGEKMMGIMQEFAAPGCYAVILDVSMEQTPVLWAASGVNITNDLIKAYDAKYPVAAAAPPAAGAAPAARPGVPAGSNTVARPPAAPTTKKQ